MNDRPEWAKDDEDEWTLMGEWITAWARVPAEMKDGTPYLRRDPLRMYWHPAETHEGAQ